VAPRACVRVYARVLVPPNLYIHTYIHTPSYNYPAPLLLPHFRSHYCTKHIHSYSYRYNYPTNFPHQSLTLLHYSPSYNHLAPPRPTPHPHAFPLPLLHYTLLTTTTPPLPPSYTVSHTTRLQYTPSYNYLTLFLLHTFSHNSPSQEEKISVLALAFRDTPHSAKETGATNCYLQKTEEEEKRISQPSPARSRSVAFGANPISVTLSSLG